MSRIIGPDIDPRYETNVPVYFLNGLGLAAATKRRLKSLTPFLSYFPKPEGTDEPYNKGEFIRTGRVLQLIDAKVRQYYGDTTKFAKEYIAKGLNPNSPADVQEICRRTYQWLIDYVQYKQDRAGREELRRPSRVVKEATMGADCDCYAYFISTVLYNLQINHKLRIIAIGDADTYHHIYVIVPRNWNAPCQPYRDKANYTVVDPVLDEFDKEPDDIAAYHDYPMITNTTKPLNGLRGTALDDLYQKLKVSRQMMTDNPESYRNAGVEPKTAIPMLTQAINAWNTPNRTAVLNALAAKERQMYNGLGGYPMNGFFQNVVNTVKQVTNNVVNTARQIVTDPKAAVNNLIGEAKALVDKVIDYGRQGALFIPRKSFMALVELNVRGLASNLRKALDIPEQRERLRRVWEGDLGGRLENLTNSINRGANRPFLFGLGSLNGDPVTIATLTASAASVVAFIEPIIDTVKKITTTVEKGKEVIASAKDAANSIQDLVSGGSNSITLPNSSGGGLSVGPIQLPPSTPQIPPPPAPAPPPGAPQQEAPFSYYKPPELVQQENSTKKNNTMLYVAGGGLLLGTVLLLTRGNKNKAKGLSGIKSKRKPRRAVSSSKHKAPRRVAAHVTF